MPIIELKDVSKLYGFGDATTVALDEISISIEKGEFVAIMGPSGSGKSTLMNIIGMLDRPTHGQYNFNSRSVARLRASRQAKIRRDKIGFVFQSFNLLPKLTALENVALPLAYKGMLHGRRLKQASVVMERVGLEDREYYFPRQLSGGQMQRVAIARALVNNPDVIIADEPTGNLDTAASLLVMELLSDIHKSGNTILLVTHNPNLTRYASRVIYMQDGMIMHDEQTDVGKVPARAKRFIFSVQKKTEEDDLAGVSALMNALPGKQPKTRKRKTTKKRSSAKQRNRKL